MCGLRVNSATLNDEGFFFSLDSYAVKEEKKKKVVSAYQAFHQKTKQCDGYLFSKVKCFKNQ